MDMLMPNMSNMYMAIICTMCGLQNQIDNMLLNNLAIEVKYDIIQETRGLSVQVSRNGNWQFNYSDWNNLEETSKVGDGVITGTADWCFSIDDDKTIHWNIKSVTVNNFKYTPTSVIPDTRPGITIRVPDQNGTIVYQNSAVQGNLNVPINRTVTLNRSGALGTGANTGWIQFLHIYNDWVRDDEIKLYVQFDNNNVDSVPIC